MFLGLLLPRLALSQTLDNGFTPPVELDNAVYALAPYTNGSILIGGAFSSGLQRLSPDGTRDASFGGTVGGFSPAVFCLSAQPDQAIVAGGEFIQLAGENLRLSIGRLTPDGYADDTFLPAPGPVRSLPYVYSVLLQPGNRLLAGGSFTTLNGVPCNDLGFLNADGTLDTNFNAGADSSVYIYSLAAQTNGQVLVGGMFSALLSQPRAGLARLNSDMTLDTHFNASVDGVVYCLAVQADGKILVGGSFTQLNGAGCNNLGRLHADGTLDTNFNASVDGLVYSLALQTDGKFVVGGAFAHLDGTVRNNLGRLNADGSLDSTFNAGTDGEVDALALQPDGQVLVGGNFSMLAGGSRPFLGRLLNTAAAQQDLSFDGATVLWTRTGTAPELLNAAFDYSTNGTDWTPLGSPVRMGNAWQLGGLSLPATLTLRARGRVTGGFYNGSSWLVESTVTSTSLWPPVILTGPTNQTRSPGLSASFAVQAGGTAPLHYQWYRDNQPLPGASDASLQLSNLSMADAGGYTVVITNAAGSITNSPPAALSLESSGAPSILTPPENQSALAGSDVGFSVEVSGTPPFTFQWFKDGRALTEATLSANTNASLQLTNVGAADAGDYTVVIQNDIGAVTSAPPATLTVFFPPTITRQPQDQTVFPHATVVLNVAAAGTPSLTYRWRKNGADLNHPAGLSGAGADTLVLSNVTASDAGSYSVVITNSYGSITSSDAALVVSAPFIPARGTYNGLFYESTQVALGRSGFLTLAVTPLGQFTGTLLLGKERYTGKGQFDRQSPLNTSLWRHGGKILVLTLQPDLTPGIDGLVGSVTGDGWSSQVWAERAAFDARTNPAPCAGSYTLVIPGDANNLAYPSGDGFGTLKVDAAGIVSFLGTLADGTPFTQKVALSKQGDWPLYAALAAGKGAVLSWLTFTNRAADDLHGPLSWIRPPSPKHKPFPAAVIPDSFEAWGSRYTPPTATNLVLTLTNGALVFSGPTPSGSPFTNAFALGGHNKVANAGAKESKLSLTFKLPTGAFSGSVLMPGSGARVAFKGVVLQKQAGGSGFFLRNGQSGRVSLGKDPSP